jgi:hypothetical protein
VRRGWEVRRDARALGELFEGSGPFISSAQTAGPNPMLAGCAYVSLDEQSEARIAALIARATRIEDVTAALIDAGFELSAIEDPARLEVALPVDSARSPFGDFRG